MSGVHRDQPRTRTSQSEQVSTLAVVISSGMSMGLEMGEWNLVLPFLLGTSSFFPLGLAKSRPGAASYHLARA